jgi:hypothetical protein
VRYRDLSPMISEADPDTSDAESSDGSSDDDDEFERDCMDDPEVALAGDLDGYDGDDFAVRSEADLAALELQDLLSDIPLRATRNIPVPTKAPATKVDDEAVIWAFDL